MGDGRTYENVIALRAVTSTDGMTADWVRSPTTFSRGSRAASSTRSRAATGVVYDITPKPPSTIEWE